MIFFQKNYTFSNNLNSNIYNEGENGSNINGENENGIYEEIYGANVDIEFPNYPADETIPLTWKANEKEILKNAK